ncbi:MAG: aspartate aminotransferase family protein [Pseudomonadota bacterium]
MNTYARMPVAFVRGQGAWLFDEQGHQYLDSISGIGVCNLGHADPVLAEAIANQSATLIHTANLGHIRLQEQLAERLCQSAYMDKAFITNTGAEAIECAIKIARHHGHSRGIEKPQILCVDGAFHGRTLGAISASAPGKLQQGFSPLLPGFARVAFGDADAIDALLTKNADIVAVLLEPIQGEGGVCVPQLGYLQALRTICDRHGALLVFDEIQCGLNRTGKNWAHQHEADSRPDLLTTAKALGNGIPVAACIGSGAAAETLTPGSHGSTFGGSPMACRAALTVLARMDELDLVNRARATGEAMLARFRESLSDHPRVADIRGRGLMIGIELHDPAADVRDFALEHHVVINVTRDTVIRLLPPLIIDQAQAEQIVDTVVAGINAEAV